MTGTAYIEPAQRARGERLMAEWAVEDAAAEIVAAESFRARLAGRPSGLAQRIAGAK